MLGNTQNSVSSYQSFPPKLCSSQHTDHRRAEMLSGQNGCASTPVLEAQQICIPGQSDLGSTWTRQRGCPAAPAALSGPGERWLLFGATISGSRRHQRGKLQKFHPGFDRAARETGAVAEIAWTVSQGSERRCNRKGKITSVTSSDVYSVWFPGSTSATESWECWIICMEQIQCSDKPKPMRDTGSSSASHHSQKASLRHPRGQSEPSSSPQFLQSPVTSRVRDNDLSQIVF